MNDDVGAIHTLNKTLESSGLETIDELAIDESKSGFARTIPPQFALH